MDLSQKVVVVTGAARGVGAVIATLCAGAGAHVVVADILEEPGEAVATGIGPTATFAHLDVTDEAGWERLVGDVVDDHGRLDVLVNNAAVLHMGTLENTSAETFRRVIDVNTVGPFLGTRAVRAQMAEQGGGAIVNIGSIDGMLATNGLTAYVSSKFALRGLTKAAALELGRDGIRVNCIASGGGNPEMYEPWFEQMMPFLDETVAFQNDRAVPGGVAFEAIATAVVYLASDAGANVTGIDLPVDNGATAGHFIAGFNTL